MDFCNKMIQRKPVNRLGYHGFQEVMRHPWLQGVDWEQMRQKTLTSPYIPGLGDNYDSRMASQEWKDDEQAVTAAGKQPGIHTLFEGYFYDEKLNATADTNCELNADRKHMLP
jgi:hypothetical protein